MVRDAIAVEPCVKLDAGNAAIIGLYHCTRGNYEQFERCFDPIATKAVHGYYCSNRLCLGMWQFWFLYALCMHRHMRNYKVAKYMYKCALQERPNDALTHIYFGMLMRQAGREGMRARYWKKAKQLDPNISAALHTRLPLSNISKHVRYDDRSTMTAFDECCCCRGTGINFKKCSRCKVRFYCSKKCQKNHWTKGHREECRLNTKVTCKDRLISFLEICRHTQQ